LSSRGRVEADIQANTALAIAEAVFIGTSVMGQETRWRGGEPDAGFCRNQFALLLQSGVWAVPPGDQR
jgi:hypothetical protein